MNYQWTIGSGSFPSKVTGINTNTLVIPDVRSSDDNAYTCTISNDGGGVTSNPAQLSVTGMNIKYYHRYTTPKQRHVPCILPVQLTSLVSYEACFA